MPQLAFGCPHCRAEKIGFALRGSAQVRPSVNQTLMFLQCEGCGEAVIAVCDCLPVSVQQWATGASQSPGNISRKYPEPTALQCPADVPPQVQSAFLSGLENLGRTYGANAAAIMFRRAIEIATKVVNPSASKRDTLEKRINDLSDDIATPAMKEWAHHVRLDANEAAHEPEEFSKEDAQKLHTFAEMFLTYAFTLPAMLKRAKEQPA